MNKRIECITKQDANLPTDLGVRHEVAYKSCGALK
jgi:hypothetical protein